MTTTHGRGKGRPESSSEFDLDFVVETAYPAITAGTRVRVVEMGAQLAPFGIRTHVRSSATDDEYELISRPGITPRKLAAVGRTLVRSARRPRCCDGLTAVYRLRSLLATPRDDAPLDVYDFDDALYVGDRSENNYRLAVFKHEADRCRRYMRQARLVIAGNQTLADEAMRFGTRIEVVPSCVDPQSQEMRRHRDVETITLGWVGSATTSKYLVPVLDVLEALQARGRRVRLLAMGASPSLRAAGLEHRPWSVEGERQFLTEIDIGLMPIPDDPWTRGKCGFKLLRYFSAGLPTVGSPVGVNRELLAGGRGLSATTGAEWTTAIEELMRDTTARQDIGESARRLVEQEFSYAVWAPRVAELLRTLA